ncbi:TonB-dependent receptor, partial [Bacteroidota bacterium]
MRRNKDFLFNMILLQSFNSILFFLTVCVLLSGKIISQPSDSSYKHTHLVQTVVVTANKFETKVTDSPSRIEVLDHFRIKRSNGTRLADLLQTASGLTIKSYSSSPMLQTVSMNGLGSEHTIILLDGIKLNSFQNSTLDLSLIPKEIIGRVEIVSNGASSLYGSEAIGGVINIITDQKSKILSNRNYSIKISGSMGSFGYKTYSLNLVNRIGDFFSDIFYSQQKSDGNYEYYYDNGISKTKKKRENAGYELYDTGLSLLYLINSSSRLKLF